MEKMAKARVVIPSVLAFLVLFPGTGFPETGGADSHESHHPTATMGQAQPSEIPHPDSGWESPPMSGGMMGGGMTGGMMQGLMEPGEEKGISACGSPGPGEPAANDYARCEGSPAHAC